MQISSMQNAYNKCGIVLWVTPDEIRGWLRRMNYADSVCIELSEWIARKMSMTFSAGQRETKPPTIIKSDLLRMLKKMGYCVSYANELATYIYDLLPALYAKGQSRKNVR